MIDASILRAMQSAGASTDVIIAAVEADAALGQVRIDTKRANDAERQRRHRASRDVTVTEGDNADSVTSAPFPAPPMKENLTPPPIPPDIYIPRARADNFPRPEWADRQVWEDLKTNRRTKRLACTPTAHAKLLRDIDGLTNDEWPPGRVLEAIVARGWAAAAHDPREIQNGRSRNTDNLANLRGSRPNPALDMVLAAERELQAEAERENQGADWPARIALPSR